MTAENAYKKRLEGHFKPLLEKHGEGHQAVDWGSKEGQNLRFNVISRVFAKRPQQEEISVLDVGCGLGHFYDYMQTTGLLDAGYTYRGIDLLGEMVERAQSRVPGVDFSVFDVFSEIGKLPEYDYIVASGLFFCSDKAAMEEAIALLYSKCRVALVFNSLSTLAPSQDAGDFYADPVNTLAYCQSHTAWVSLRHDYMPNDFTVFMYKEKNS